MIDGKRMKILFVMEHRSNAGSTHALANYMRVADQAGHSIALYGTPESDLIGIQFSRNVAGFDRLVFLFESKLYRVKRVEETKLLATIPRRHRFVFDADGMFNPRVELDGYDRSHADESEQKMWRRHFEALSDRVLQPLLTPPTDRRVTALPFYGYNPHLRMPASPAAKRFDVVLVGHNWWRWRDVAEMILPALERVRARLGRIGFIGQWWDGPPEWTQDLKIADAFCSDPERLRSWRVEVAPAVRYAELIATMSDAHVNLLTQRPILRHFQHVTHKYFEVFCADTIPLLLLEPAEAERVYGPAGRELTLSGRVEAKIMDALQRPHRYREIVETVRRHLEAHHSYRQRLQELLAVMNDYVV